ncbi:RICIN domain-containing protein [Streptomyces sp. NPDC051567]|uniref:RICIN domain-containing protein n=1 Tax=Streptomyces sp. NPDC051567 TaxID=3365660 RepID=UPI00378ACCB4
MISLSRGLIRTAAVTTASLTCVGAFASTVAAAPASTGGAGGRLASGVCLDVGNTRANDAKVRIWECLDHPNQEFVIDAGRVKVADTVGTAKEMCLDTGNTRNNGDRVRIWECLRSSGGVANQSWVVRGGALVVENTIGAGREMCADVGNTRRNGDSVTLYQCASTNTNQKFVVQRGYIKVKDTL